MCVRVAQLSGSDLINCSQHPGTSNDRDKDCIDCVAFCRAAHPLCSDEPPHRVSRRPLGGHSLVAHPCSEESVGALSVDSPAGHARACCLRALFTFGTGIGSIQRIGESMSEHLRDSINESAKQCLSTLCCEAAAASAASWMAHCAMSCARDCLRCACSALSCLSANGDDRVCELGGSYTDRVCKCFPL